MIGTKLGPYEITAQIGEGGMGLVFKAKDFQLGREVALKVLPEGLTADPERLARFEREAKLLASLNHPNIAQIYGLETSGASPALVMELVEGPTLADRLAQGSLSIDESLSIARQIAEALEEAHEKGIVHRDLKPQNVKASIEGKVKVLDFGLAKAMEPAGAASGSGSPSGGAVNLTHSPTLTSPALGTMQGVILGTAAYMSPEQARGGAVDKRADIWAFGVVLWEMLTGRRLFASDTVSDTLAGVLRQEVDLGALPAEVPPAIRRLLRRCLERSPKNRLHDIADARIVLDEVLSGRDAAEAPSASVEVGETPGRRLRLAALAVVLLAVGVAAGWLLRPRAPAVSAPDSRWTLALPDGYSLSTADVPQLALSRDGKELAAVVVGENGVSQLLVRRSDEFEPRLLDGSEGAVAPFFSPDGDWVGFFRDDALMKIPVGGGPSVRLASLTNQSRGGTWSTDGWIYFVGGFAEALSRVPENGGKVEAVTQLDAKRAERTHRWPEVLPDGGAVLFTCDTQASTEYYDDARIEAVRPATGERTVLIEGASQARYAPGGHLVFARGGSLYSVSLDPRTLEVRGSPVVVAQGVATNVGSGAVQFAIAQSGAALWSPGGLSASYGVVWVDRKGVESPVDIPPGPYNELSLSPDGTRLALVGGPGGISDLWVADLGRGALTRLTSGVQVRSPTWSPDGTRIAYGAVMEGAGEGRMRIDWRPADGSRGAETLVKESPGAYPSSFTPDGKVLIFDQYQDAANNRSTVLALPVGGGGHARALTEGPYANTAGVVSPDGRWLAYVSDESGQSNIYVRPYPEGPGRWQISTLLGVEPHWSRDGRELFYRVDAVLYRVAIDTSHGFSAGRPERYLDRVASGGEVKSYSFSPDGSRLFTLRTPEGSGARRVLYLDLGFARRLDSLAAGKR
jgi:Tol biopolymer transport system component